MPPPRRRGRGRRRWRASRAGCAQDRGAITGGGARVGEGPEQGAVDLKAVAAIDQRLPKTTAAAVRATARRDHQHQSGADRCQGHRYRQITAGATACARNISHLQPGQLNRGVFSPRLPTSHDATAVRVALWHPVPKCGWARLRRELQAGGITARSATRSSVQLCGGRQVAAEAALQDKSHYWKNVADYTLPDLPYDYVLWNPTSLGRSWNCTTPNTTPPESRVLIPR